MCVVYAVWRATASAAYRRSRRGGDAALGRAGRSHAAAGATERTLIRYCDSRVTKIKSCTALRRPVRRKNGFSDVVCSLKA